MTYEQLIQGLDGGSVPLIPIRILQNFPMQSLSEFIDNALDHWDREMIFAVIQEIAARGIESIPKVLAEVTTPYS